MGSAELRVVVVVVRTLSISYRFELFSGLKKRFVLLSTLPSNPDGMSIITPEAIASASCKSGCQLPFTPLLEEEYTQMRSNGRLLRVQQLEKRNADSR